MNRLLIIIGIFLSLIALSYTLVKFQKPQTVPPPAVTVVPTQIIQPTITMVNQNYCTAQDLNALVSLDHGAGNIYGTLTLKNISQKTCQIAGENFIVPQYDTATVKNITVSHTGQAQTIPFIVAPGQTLYSQVHYPNGPQCQSIGVKQTRVSFAYAISPSEIITYKDATGIVEQAIQTCKALTDITEIQVWHMSTKPITQ